MELLTFITFRTPTLPIRVRGSPESPESRKSYRKILFFQHTDFFYIIFRILAAGNQKTNGYLTKKYILVC